MPNFENYTGLVAVQRALSDAGIPYTGMSCLPVPSGQQPNYTNESGDWLLVIHFTDAATPLQKTQARDIIANTDKRPRKKRTPEEQKLVIDSLSSSQKNRLLEFMLAERLTVDPAFARRVGINIDGDLDPVVSPQKAP